MTICCLSLLETRSVRICPFKRLIKDATVLFLSLSASVLSRELAHFYVKCNLVYLFGVHAQEYCGFSLALPGLRVEDEVDFVRQRIKFTVNCRIAIKQLGQMLLGRCPGRHTTDFD